MEEVMRRFSKLPLSDTEKGKISAQIVNLSEDELRKLFPARLNDSEVATALKTKYLWQPVASAIEPSTICGDLQYDDLVESWWRGTRNWNLDKIEAGQEVEMFDLKALSALEVRLSVLYVRRCFEPLFLEICNQPAGDWACHLNGNSGVGRSAFLWYFIIKMGILCKQEGVQLHILYESAGYICQFRDDLVRITRRENVPDSVFVNASWHLINQEVPEDGAIGRRLLVAASPAKSGIKTLKADQKQTVMYLYPWEEDEYLALVDLWRRHYQRLEDMLAVMKGELQRFEKLTNTTWTFPATKPPLKVGWTFKAQEAVKQVMGIMDAGMKQADEVASAVCEAVFAIEMVIRDGLKRVAAASDCYSYFGGVVGLFWSDHVTIWNSEGFADAVRTSLRHNDVLYTVQDGCESEDEDEERALLHFSKPTDSSSFTEYCLSFCSVKVQDMFAMSLTREKAKELDLFLRTTAEIPAFGGLRGFVFEELCVGAVLHGAITMAHMVDNKHCSSCSFRKPETEPTWEWVACNVCANRYHSCCVPSGEQPEGPWTCKDCESKEGAVSVHHKRQLMYYEGSLQQALLNAGAAAQNYVWRPLRKNNGAIDFVILPNVLAQPTVADCHPVAAAALKDHVAALNAWNDCHGNKSEPLEIALCFLLCESNYYKFGFQSYRDARQRVTNQAVQGIQQYKSLLKGDGLVSSLEQMDVPHSRVEVVDFDECKFDEVEVCQLNDFDQDTDRGLEKERNKQRKWVAN